VVHSLSRFLHSILANLRLPRGIGNDGAKKGRGTRDLRSSITAYTWCLYEDVDLRSSITAYTWT
jgi:hypothetical protein